MLANSKSRIKIIDNFPVERFQISCNLLFTLCKPSKSDSWLDPSKLGSTKDYIYRGSFMDCVEYLYGFIPEVFKEYCKTYRIKVYSNDGRRVGHLDLMDAMLTNHIIEYKFARLLKKIFKIRGELIHSTLIDKKGYYNKLISLVSEINNCDLQELIDTIVIMCNKINNSHTANRNLIVGKREYHSTSSHNCKNPLSPSSIFD